jgi:hypothetical protein
MKNNNLLTVSIIIGILFLILPINYYFFIHLPNIELSKNIYKCKEFAKNYNEEFISSFNTNSADFTFSKHASHYNKKLKACLYNVEYYHSYIGTIGKIIQDITNDNRLIFYSSPPTLESIQEIIEPCEPTNTNICDSDEFDKKAKQLMLN